MKHYCGIIGLISNNIKKELIPKLALLQHRGQDSAGLSYVSKQSIHTYKNIGLVKKVFKNYQYPHSPEMSIGHVRYSTLSKKNINQNKLKLAQPIQTPLFSLAHNGNIPNIQSILQDYNINIESISDSISLTLIITKLIQRYNNIKDALINIINKISGAYSLVILTQDGIYACRDKFGYRPLCYGQKDNSYCVTSESVALQKYTYIRELNPGELIYFQPNKEPTTLYQVLNSNTQFCSFELIYFMDEKSFYQNRQVYQLRRQVGYKFGLEEKNIDENAIVIPIPRTSKPYGLGFAKATNLNYQEYILKKKQANRTFILPTNEERIKACGNKFMYDIVNLKDKTVYIIDDSIVRGNTMRCIVNKLKELQVKKIHIRIMAPIIISQCYYGIDMPTKEELIGHHYDIDGITTFLGCTTLKYVSLELIKKVYGNDKCYSCFTDKHNSKLLDF